MLPTQVIDWFLHHLRVAFALIGDTTAQLLLLGSPVAAEFQFLRGLQLF